MFARLTSSLRTLIRRGGFEDDMADEMRFHLEARTADLIRRGMAPDAAARQARIEFGSLEKAKDRARESFGLRLIDETAGDVRYALRTFRRNKAFAATAVMTLALGIGANTAIFSLIDALLLRWLPVRDPQQLVQLTIQSPSVSVAGDSFSYPMARALDQHREIFDGVAGFSGTTLDVGAPGAVVAMPGAIVTGAYYETLGLT
ncbi:MAG: permease prefix domain 1-containing protein, partial [Vicinamibacterales bacterium]